MITYYMYVNVSMNHMCLVIYSCVFVYNVLHTISHIFFFKQKTAYDMLISDWSSDVCSSDLFRGLMARRLFKHTTSYQYPHLRTMCSDPLTSSPFAPTTLANFTMAGRSLLPRAIHSDSSSPSAIRQFRFANLRLSSREPSFEALEVLAAKLHATPPGFT